MDKYATPSPALQQAILDSLAGRPKYCKELVNEGISADRTVQAALSYMKEKGLIIEDHRGDYNRVYYAPVGRVGEGLHIPMLRVTLRGQQIVVGSLLNLIKDRSPLMPLKLILYMRMAKSIAKMENEQSVFQRAGSYDTLKQAIDYLERSLTDALDLVAKIKRTPILWQADEGLLWRMTGVNEASKDALMLALDWVTPEFEEWFEWMKSQYSQQLEGIEE